MERVLLVEPGYNNKYPPIGLMKIAMYHKMRGDYVEFYKGNAPFILISRMDRIYITSLFTFYFDVTVETILHYANYLDKNKIYLGGISATLMRDRFEKETGIKNILVGQLTNSSMIGYEDGVNIDILPLDYDILDDIEYQYGIEDNFFAYATRGCPRRCEFCAVKTLEPKFFDTNNIINQVSSVREIYGDKRNIMLMDNNVIFSSNLQEICNNLVKLGFVKNKATYIPQNPAVIFFAKTDRRMLSGNPTWMLEDKFITFLKAFIKRIKKQEILDEINLIINEALESGTYLLALNKYREPIIRIVEKYRSKKPLQRYVDFNQGLDARLLTDEKMAVLSVLPLRPFRLAYDDIDSTEEYLRAFNIAYRHGVRHFSNYMLYNFKDTPEDFWQRAYNNVNLHNNYPEVSTFSFPMKYAPIDMTDRSYIGTHWNKKYLSAMNVILNVTKGIIAKERDFFVRAYGKTSIEFREILSMPNEFIKFRNLFDNLGFTEAWRQQFRKLDCTDVELLLMFVTGESTIEISDKKLLSYYKITKRQIETKKIDISDYL